MDTTELPLDELPVEPELAALPGPPLSRARRFWRVPAMAVICALLGFMASFILGPAYQAKTALLVRPENATFLNSNGTTLDNGGAGSTGVLLDTSMAKSIADTESALIGNYTIAREVVNQLHLVPPPTKTSLLGHVKNAVKDVYVEGKAYLVHGTYKQLSPYDQAVQNVQAGLSANQLNDSSLIELDGAGKSPAQAESITNTAASDLVTLVNDQFRNDVNSELNTLSTQMTSASKAEQSAATALQNFGTANNLSPNAVEALASGASTANLDAELADTQAQVQGAQAQLSSDQAALSKTAQTTTSTQQVETGRSTTQVNQTQANPTYQQLQVAVANDQAKVASLQATAAQLSKELAPGFEASALPAGLQAQYNTLEAQFSTAQTAFAKDQASYEQALSNQANAPKELSRVDQAVSSTYPVSPKRYLFLGFGLLLGLIAGFLLSARAAHRRGETLFAVDEDDLVPASEYTEAVVHVNGQPTRPYVEEPTILLDEGVVTRRQRLGNFEVYRSAGGPPLAPTGSGNGKRTNGNGATSDTSGDR
jgi:uncharacterized protein involved in exopolysaccharide biosynthesis